MANNGIFYTSGNTLDFTTTGITWARLSSGGTFSSFGLSATTYYNLPFSGTVVGSGTTNYVPLWTGSTGLGNSIIRANNTNVSINTSIDSNVLLNLYFTGFTGLYSSGDYYGVQGVAQQSTGFGVYGINNSGAGTGAGVYGSMGNGIGVYGDSAGELGPNFGVKGTASGINGGTPENIAGYFESYGDGTSYSLQLKDGTEDIDKVLISKTFDGKANWSGELNISGITATTISATTYYNLPQSVSGTGTQDYVTKWDSSTSGITNSEIYSTSGFIGLFTSSAFYGGEIVSMSTSNKGITIDGLYLREDGNGSIAMAVGFDYSTWTSGGNEIAIGNGTPLSSSAGQYNIAIGNRSLLSNTIGNNNVSIGGSHTLFSNITGSSNVAIGHNSLRNNIIGNYNVAIGEGTGYANLGSSNVYLGYAAGYNNDGNGNIFIGYSAGYGDTSSSNKLNIGDTIIGDLSAKSINVPTISATTYDNLPGSSSSNCYTTFYVTNISGCSPVNILSPLNLTEGINVTGVTNFTNTVDFIGGLTASTVSATTYQNLPVSGLTQGSNVTITNNGNGNYTISSTGGGGVSGSGTTNYLPKWTGSTGIGNSQIRDDGTYLGIGITPSSPNKLWVYSNSLSYGIRGDGTVAGVYGQAVSSGYGVYGSANSSAGVAGVSIGDVGTNVGVYGVGDVNDSGSPTNIGGHFLAQNGGSNYSVHLQDGTEGVNKVLISTTSDGKANWSNVLTGLTNVRSTTISATTYQGNVVTQITAGSGISIDQSTGNVTITATGGGGGGLTFQQVQMVAFLSS